MRTGVRWAAIILAMLLFTGTYAAFLVDRADGAIPSDCWSNSEWGSIQDDYGTVTRSARRHVIEKGADVSPVGYRNQYWLPANTHLYYSLAYKFCSDPSKKVVLVYRKTSGSWQYALMGQLQTVALR
jgi:hypothetical protein